MAPQPSKNADEAELTACAAQWKAITEWMDKAVSNSTKPDRPSHNLHTYWISNLRLVLDVELQPGKISAAKYSLPHLRKLIEGLAPEERPTLVRGDNAFDNVRVMFALESIGQKYIFKPRQTPNVKRLIEKKWDVGEWKPVGQGFDAVESELKLAGWTRTRRVIVLRRLKFLTQVNQRSLP